MGAEYQPGVCNIGHPERRARYAFGAMSTLLAAAIVIAVPLLSLPRWVLLVTVFPLFGGFIGYYQGRAGFCVRFAMAGIYNVTDRLGTRVQVADDAAARRDRRRARTLVWRSAVSAVIVAFVLYLVVPV